MQTYICRILGWRSGVQFLTEKEYSAPSWPAAMAMANLDGHGNSVASWIMPSGVYMMMHDSRLSDVNWSEDGE